MRIEQNKDRFDRIIIQRRPFHRREEAIDKACRGTGINGIDKKSGNNRKGKQRDKEEGIPQNDSAHPFSGEGKRQIRQTGGKAQKNPQESAQYAKENGEEKQNDHFPGQKLPERNGNGQNILKGVVGVFPAGKEASGQQDQRGEKTGAVAFQNVIHDERIIFPHPVVREDGSESKQI